MSKTKRTRYSAEFKSKVALDAIKGEHTLAELAAKYSLHPNMITNWKRRAIDNMAETFSSKADRTNKLDEDQLKDLHAKIGQLTIERDFLGQSLRSLSQVRRKSLVKPNQAHGLSIVRQCELLAIGRSSYYYQSTGETFLNLQLMRLIDEQFMKTPYYGACQMTRHLRREGYGVNRKRIGRLMRNMSLSAIYQKPNTSKPHPEHKIYPYLLRGMIINQPNQVWCTDITYIPMRRGFLYLVAIMDWASRKVLSWRLSNTMDTDFCIEALEEAIENYGTPEIFNTDQGSQFTSHAFTSVLNDAGIKISMDGKGRWMDNVMIERLWRSLKYECIYLHAFETGSAARQGIGHWIKLYNEQRPHSKLDDKTPDEAYWQKP
ncbi:MAG: IS3 family transposase, partial [Desulfuromusa sp.]|nr:IS3 family transposase [Desulfuromusa sp.]